MMGHQVNISARYQMIFDDENVFAKKYIDEYEQYILLGNGERKLGKVDKRVEILEKQLNKTNKKLEDMGHLVNRLVRRLEGLGTIETIMPKVEDVLPGDIEGLPERVEIVEDSIGKMITKDLKKQADKILKDKEK